MFGHININNSKNMLHYKNIDETENDTVPNINLTSSYLNIHQNTTDKLRAQVKYQAFELEQKKFKLTFLKNDEKTYLKIIKSLMKDHTEKKECLQSLQQRIFDNRTIFSDELMSFAISTTTSVEELECIYESIKPKIPNFDEKDSTNFPPDSTFHDADDKIFEEIALFKVKQSK